MYLPRRSFYFIKCNFNVLGKSGSSSLTKKQNTNIITHPRFLGKDDHVVHELIQKPRNPIPTSLKTYNCAKCGFTTTRIEVIIYHGKSHLRGKQTAPVGQTKPVKSKLKLPRAKTSTIDEDLELLRQGYSIGLSSSNEEDDLPTESPKVQKKKKTTKRKSKPKTKSVPETKKDVHKDILAEWQDSDEENEESVKNDTSNEKMDSNNVDNKLSADKFEMETDSNKNDIEKNKNEDTPEVIVEAQSECAEKDSKKSDSFANEDITFTDVLEKTTLAPLPELPDLPKAVEKKVAVKPVEKTDTHPKKRFVKSFEDFELFLKNQMKNESKLKENEVESEIKGNYIIALLQTL